MLIHSPHKNIVFSDFKNNTLEIALKTLILRQKIRIEVHNSVSCDSFLLEVIPKGATKCPLFQRDWNEQWIIPCDRILPWNNFFDETKKEHLTLLEVENYYLDDLSAQSGKFSELIYRFLRLFLASPPRMQVQEYSQTLKVSQQYLNKCLKRHLGYSVNALVLFRLLLEAKNKLVYTTLPIKAIAYELGFTELSNFYNFFKKHTTLTPHQFRHDFGSIIVPMELAEMDVVLS